MTWDKGAGQGGKQLLDAAPQGLKDTKDLFENLFFVAADIPDTVFMSPTDGTPETNDEQTDHALKSGIAALSVMSKRMHVLHANDSPGLCTDMALNASITQNHGNGRLGAFLALSTRESRPRSGRPSPICLIAKRVRRIRTSMSMCKPARGTTVLTDFSATDTKPRQRRCSTTSSTCK